MEERGRGAFNTSYATKITIVTLSFDLFFPLFQFCNKSRLYNGKNIVKQ
jgi:hypothetical protein